MVRFYVDGPPSAPALALSSSLGTTHAMWEPQVAAFAAGHRVIRYDRRGHGESALPAAETTIDDLGRDVLDLLDELELERTSFCGLSIGGLVGMWLALNAPDRLDRLVLACTRAAFLPASQWADRVAVVRDAGIASIADAVLDRWFTPAFPVSHPAELARFREMLVSTQLEGYVACCEVLGAVDFRGRLGEIASPTLVITGSADPVVPPEAGAELAAAIPGARHLTIDGAAHIANVEQPRAFGDAVLAFLAEGADG